MTDKPNPSRSPQRSRKTRAGQVNRVRNQNVVVPTGYLAVGHIIGVHGLRGELKIELYTDFPERYAPGVTLFMGPELDEVEVRQVRPHKGHLLIMLDGINDRTTAEGPVSYTHLRAHETVLDLVCRLLLEKKKNKRKKKKRNNKKKKKERQLCTRDT